MNKIDYLKALNMADLLAYFKQQKRVFAQQAKGAADEEIKKFEKITGRTLPADVVTFLKTAGDNTGDLFIPSQEHGNYDFTLQTAIKHHLTIKNRVERRPPLAKRNYFNPAFVCIGTQNHCQDCGNYYLDFRQPGEPPVIRMSDDDEVHVLAPTFREFLLKFSFPENNFEHG